MALQDLLVQINASRPAVDARGVFTREVAEALQRLIQAFNANVNAANSEMADLTGAQYLVSTANATLTGERVTTDTATVSWDHSTAAQAKANVVDGSITTTKLGGDITTAGKALLDDATAGDQLTTLGVSAFVQTLLNDANASAALTTLGVSAFIQTLLDDANAATALATLGAMAATTTLDAIPAPVASVDFVQQQALQFVVENRTSDPASPVPGQIWFRTDL